MLQKAKKPPNRGFYCLAAKIGLNRAGRLGYMFFRVSKSDMRDA